jgi:hypothetical protein
MNEICMHGRKKLKKNILIHEKIVILYMWELEQLKENYNIAAFSKTVNWEIKSKSCQPHFIIRQLCVENWKGSWMAFQARV